MKKELFFYIIFLTITLNYAYSQVLIPVDQDRYKHHLLIEVNNDILENQLLSLCKLSELANYKNSKEAHSYLNKAVLLARGNKTYEGIIHYYNGLNTSQTKSNKLAIP